MHFDFTITAGNIITLVATLGSLVLFAWRLSWRMAKMELKFDMVWDWFKRIHKIKIKNGDGE